MIVKFDRSSVCMADDCTSHIEAKSYRDTILLSGVLQELITYVPSMYNSVWVISAKNTSKKYLGYIVTDRYANSKIELNTANTALLKLCTDNTMIMTINCNYYHQNTYYPHKSYYFF